MASPLREQGRSHFRLATRATWAVENKTYRASGAHQPRHLQHRADGATRAGTSDGSVPESLNKASDVLAVTTLRCEYDNLSIAPPIGRHHDPLVPKDVDGKS